MAWKARRQLAKSRPCTELPRTCKAWMVEQAWAAMILTWGCQSNFSVMKTPRYRTVCECHTERTPPPGTLRCTP